MSNRGLTIKDYTTAKATKSMRLTRRILKDWKLAGSILAVRTFLQFVWVWNMDIQRAIIPGLQCWYCRPYEAPYGLLWHIVSVPALLFGSSQQSFITYVSLVDTVMMRAIGKRRLIIPYSVCSVWIWLQAPYDIPILWLCLAGLVAWPLAFLGPIGKLPFLAPASVWNFVLSKPYVASDWQYYGLMGVVFISVIIQTVKDRSRK
jgi:hypothetical protein